MRIDLALSVLTCLVGIYLIGINGQDPCCDSDCSDSDCPPSPYNITIEEIAETPKYYVKVVPAIPIYAGIDSICYTFFPLPDDTYLINVATVYSNGFNTTDSYTITDSEPGVFPLGSTKCREEATIFEYLDNKVCNGLYLTYEEYINGECPFEPGNDIPIVVFSTDNRPISKDCLANVTDLISKNGVESQDYMTLPMKMKDACVTSLEDCTL